MAGLAMNHTTLKRIAPAFGTLAVAALVLTGCDKPAPTAEAEPPLFSVNVNTQRLQEALAAAQKSMQTAIGQAVGVATNVDVTALLEKWQTLTTNVNLTDAQKAALRVKFTEAQVAMSNALHQAKIAAGQAMVQAGAATEKALGEARVAAQKAAVEARALAEHAEAEARAAAEKAAADAQKMGRDLSGGK